MIGMTISRALALTLTATATALTLSATPVSARPSPALDWRPCGIPGQECADLPVPLSYDDPGGPQVTVAVSRLASADPRARRGTLLVIPGGPGGSGIAKLSQQGEALRRELGNTYDLVSLDPRGVGASSRASCELEAENRQLVTLRPWPAADGTIGENVERARRFARSCADNGGPLLRSLSTLNEARDIDRLREALGEEKLSAYGSSYGTYVGAVYAQKFPARTDRWVLDSNDDPNPRAVARGWLANMAVGAEARFPDLAAWAADPARGNLRLAERPDQVRELFLSYAAELDRAPRATTTPGMPLTGNRLRQAMQTVLYNDAAFPQFAVLMKQVMDPAATPVLTPDIAGPLSDEDAAVTMAVICNDVSWPNSVAAYERSVAENRARYPLTAGMPANITACSFWKDAPAEKPVRITGDGPSNVLMVQFRRDPATPYAGALNLRSALGDRARMVTVEGGGHGVYLGKNACADRLVTRFLVTGERPARDVVCE
ncbi:alpha/beta hydrolase [Streptomyces sp. 4F14]|uniref:alpha/beta hydrolase n=1 Tax=Streptomyces sp. 4F14 TaxID=3394380 RepID=UPI003A8B2220